MPIGGAILGGIAGGQQDVATQTQDYTVNTAPLSQLGQQGNDASSQALLRLMQLLGAQDKQNSNGPAQYAQMLQQMINSGGLPDQKQTDYANQYAANIFAPQQATLNNIFQQASVDNARKAAAMGRSTNDPILAAKLAQYQGQQQSVLSGQQSALGSQLAMHLPQQQLGYAQALSQQALNNQSTLLGLGQGVLQSAQQYQLATARRSGTATNTSGGGTKGVINGIFQGAGAGMNMLSTFAYGAKGAGNGPNFGSGSDGGGGGTGYGAGAVADYGAGGSAGGMYGAGDYGATTVGGSGVEAAALA